MTHFFRDPERQTLSEPGLFIAPADGKVIRAEATEEGLRIDTFMNVFNVHVNRAPMSGRITHMQYYPGKCVRVGEHVMAGKTVLARHAMDEGSHDG